MKKTSAIALAIGSLSLTLANTASAQSYTYGGLHGPAVDVNFVQNPGQDPRYCDKYNSQVGYVAAACAHGMSQARILAERYAGGYGKLQGYLRGYAWGMNQTSSIYSNDAREIDAGRAGVDAIGSTMEAGLAAGRADGASQGGSKGSQDAIARFQAVVNTGRQPDPTVRVPQVNYPGIDNAYQKYVGPEETVQQIIQTDLHPGQIPVYSSWDATNMGEMQPLTVFDLWFSDGTYKFEHGMFYDTGKAMETWLSRAPIYDPDGRYQGYATQAAVDPITGQPTNLQAVFRDGFTYTYSYWVQWFYSSQFQQNLDLGTQVGADMGVQIGKRIANQKGLIQAYNDKFKVSSQQTFQGAFNTAYNSSFGTTFADYNGNPKLSIEFKSIIGMDDDGIIQPGEAFKAVFSVKNIGGKASSLNVGVTGNVVETNQQTLQIGALMSRDYTTDVIGKIDPRQSPRTNAHVVLSVNGIQDDLNQTVLRMTQIASTRAQIDVNNGSGTILVVANNTSTVRTPRTVSATLSLNGRPVDTQQAGFIDAGNSQQITLQFSNIDPLALIGGQVKASVTLSMGDAAADAAQVEMAVGSANASLVSYFNALAGGRGYLPMGTTQQSQTDETRSAIVGANLTEIQNVKKGPNVYKKDADETIPGMLVKTFTATTQSQGSRDQYDTLAHAMWSGAKNLHNFLFFGGKKKSYEELVQQIAKSKLK